MARQIMDAKAFLSQTNVSIASFWLRNKETVITSGVIHYKTLQKQYYVVLS